MSLKPKNDKNLVNINGVIAKIYYDVDKNGNNYCKLILESCKYILDNTIITSVKCYFYNKALEYIKNNNFKIGDYIKIIGELQNRNENLIVYTHKIFKI